jgi:hypothetical protein
MSDSDFSPEFGSPYQVLVDHCEEGDIKFRAEEDMKGVFFSVRGEAAVYDLALFITHNDEVFEVYLNMPVHAESEKLRPLVAEFVLRANSSFGVGAFDLNMDDGRLTYHAAHAFGERGLDDEAVGRLVATALQTADRYFPALTLVMFGGHTPADAIFLAELDCSADAVEDPKPADPPKKTPKALTPPAKKKARRPRRDPRLKGTQELPGLFDKRRDASADGGSNPPSAR